MGYDRWKEEYVERSNEAIRDFKKELERQQIALDRSVIDAFKQICSDFIVFTEGIEVDERHQRPRPYSWFLREKLNPGLKTLSDAVNDTMNVSTHQINLQLAEVDRPIVASGR